MVKNWIYIFSKLPIEAIIWAFGLMALAIFEPGVDSHFVVCPFSALGFDFCPGCGLGRSVSYIFHGRVADSFAVHPFGVFAILILLFRIVQLLKTYYKTYGTRH